MHKVKKGLFDMPKISIVCPSYNHEKYVSAFVDSLLKQTVEDWELIIIDDSSTDKTAEKIKALQDKRIRFVEHDFNRGINYGVSEGIRLAKSKLISFAASDDMLCPEYMENVLKAFEENKEISVCYTPLKYMDENGNLTGKILPLPHGKSEKDIFCDMFLKENKLPSPGLVFKKSALKSYLPLHYGLLQYQDYQIHLYLLYHHKIKMLETPLVLYRKVRGSASNRSHGRVVREDAETDVLMDTIVRLIGNDKDSFLEYFGNHPLLQNVKVEAKTVPYWLGRLALTSSNPAKQKWGLKTVMNFISDENNMTLLHKLYGFSFKDYLALANEVDTKCVASAYWGKKYKKKIKKLKYLVGILVLAFAVCLSYIVLR